MISRSHYNSEQPCNKNNQYPIFDYLNAREQRYKSKLFWRGEFAASYSHSMSNVWRSVLLVASTVTITFSSFASQDMSQGKENQVPDPDTISITSQKKNSNEIGESSAFDGPPESSVNLIPLEVSLLLNNKFLGTIGVKVDPLTSKGVIKSKRLLALLENTVEAKFISGIASRIENREFITFESLNSDDFEIFFDSLTLEVSATLSGDKIGKQSLSLRPQTNSPNPELFQKAAGFTTGINISALERYIYTGENSEFERPRFSLDGFMNLGGFAGITLRGGGVYDYNQEDGEQWRRKEITASKDLFNSALRFTAGEITPRLDGYQGTDRILGVGLFSAYSSIRPFQIIRPTGRKQFVIDENSTVDIFINNELSETLDLNAGSYSLEDFPLANRANNVRLDITGISGSNESLEFGVYGGSELLKPGLLEFGAFAGTREGTEEFNYTDELTGTGFLRAGINGNLTLGINGQYTEEAQQFGATAVYGSQLGLFQLETASSKNDLRNTTGRAFGLEYRKDLSLFQERDLRLAASGEYRSDYFQHAFEDIDFTPLKWRSAIQASWTGNNSFGVALGLSASESRGPSAVEQRSVDLTLRKDLGRFRFSGTVGHTELLPGEPDTRYSITVTYRPNRIYSSTARYDSTQKRRQIDFRRQASRNVGNYTGNLQYTNSDLNEQLRLGLDYVHNRFELGLRQNHRFADDASMDASGNAEFRLQTFVGLSNGRLGIGRPSQSGFVLAPVHKSLKDANIEIRNGSELIARSGWLGAPLIPLSRAYSVNRFEIVVDPLPIGYDLGEGIITTFPGPGNSYRIPIGSDASRMAMGFFITDDGPLSLITGVISPIGVINDNEKTQRSFFTNRGGRFIADRLSPGIYDVIVDEKIIANFEIPEESEGIVDLGEIHILNTE